MTYNIEIVIGGIRINIVLFAFYLLVYFPLYNYLIGEIHTTQVCKTLFYFQSMHLAEEPYIIITESLYAGKKCSVEST